MLSKSLTRIPLTTPRTTLRTTPSALPIILWFRDDLRLSDHPPLHAAAKAAATTGAPVICLYVLDDAAGRALGAAARWWLGQSLQPPGPGGDLTSVTAFEVRRAQPAPGLARRAVCRGGKLRDRSRR